MTEQAMKVSVGIFVLAAVIFLFVLAMLFGGMPTYFKQVDTYTITLDNAAGITAGTPVRKSGVKIGEVRSVALDGKTGEVQVVIQVEKGFHIRTDEVPTVVRGLLGGDTSIDFLPAEPEKADKTRLKQVKFEPDGPDEPRLFPVQAQEKVVPPGSTLKGRTPADPGRLVDQTGALITPAKETLEELRVMLQRFEKMSPLIEETMKEYRELARSARAMVPEVRKTNDELQELTRITRQTVPEFKRTNEEMQVTARTWTKVGERIDVFLGTNEEKLGKSVDRLQEALKRMNDTLSDENQKYISGTLKNLYKGSEQLDSIVRNTDDLVKEGRTTVKSLNQVLNRADEALAGLEKFSKPFGERSPIIMKNLDESTALLNRTLLDVRDLLQSVARSDGTVNKLITDPSLYNNLNDSAQMVSRILPRLDRILGDAEIFSDKIARHPESLGIGGVVRPSSGLKESPSVIPWRVIPGH